VQSAGVTPANVHDRQELLNLLPYTGQREALREVALNAKDFTSKRAARNKPLTDTNKETNRRKSRCAPRLSIRSARSRTSLDLPRRVTAG
jgi:hypothetical protein